MCKLFTSRGFRSKIARNFLRNFEDGVRLFALLHLAFSCHRGAHSYDVPQRTVWMTPLFLTQMINQTTDRNSTRCCAESAVGSILIRYIPVMCQLTLIKDESLPPSSQYYPSTPTVTCKCPIASPLLLSLPRSPPPPRAAPPPPSLSFKLRLRLAVPPADLAYSARVTQTSPARTPRVYK